MKIIETKVFTFDELSDKAKEKARDWYREGAFDDRWYDQVYEDAENIGLKITSFDTGRSQEIEGDFTGSHTETADKIIKDHGEHCQTFKLAKNFLEERNELSKAWHEDEDAVDEKIENLEGEFKKDLLNEYLSMLGKELEYLQSDESVDENIRANEYTFTEEGKRFG